MSNNSKPWHRRPRTALAACAVASLVAGLTACGSGDGDEQSSLGKDDTLTITTFSEFGYDDQIKKWNDDPDRPFKIKQTKIAEWDTWKESMTKALQAGTELPDVIAVEGDAMAALLADGANEQFADISDPDLDDRWVEYAYKAGQTTDGKQIGYPTDIGPEAMCYRADLFEKAGLPSDPADAAALFADWDTYYKTGEEFTKKVPKTKWYDASGSVAQAMLNQVEFPFQTEDQKVNVENDELKAVYDTVTKYSPTLSTKVVQWGEDWQANFTNDGFATMPCPGWMFANIKSSAPDVTGWRIADAFPGGGGNWGGSFLAVPASGAHTEEAQEVADYLTNAESQASASKAAGNFPGNLEAQKTLQSENAEDPYFGNAKTTEILTNRAAAVTPGVPFKGDKYSDVLGLFQTAIQRVDEGEDPEKSWTTFVGAVDNL